MDEAYADEETVEREDVPVIRPKEALIDGAQVVQRLLGPIGFQFQFREEGKGSRGANLSEMNGRLNCISASA
jgi:hypothetical protein